MKVLTSLLICASLPALAAQRVVVVVARPSDAAEMTVRLKAELETAGFEVVEAASAVSTGLEAAARQADATAAIAYDPSERRAVNLWVADQGSGQAASRSLELTPGATPSLLARRVVDLLQATLLDLATPGLAPPPPPPARIEVHLGGAVGWQSTFDAALAAVVGVEGRVSGPWWVGAHLWGPTVLGALRGSVGATTQQANAWASLGLHWSPGSWAELAAAVGAGGQFFSARGTAAGDSAGSAWTWTINAEAALNAWFSAHVGVRAGVGAAVAPQPVRVLVTGSEVARAATPLVAGHVALVALAKQAGAANLLPTRAKMSTWRSSQTNGVGAEDPRTGQSPLAAVHCSPKHAWTLLEAPSEHRRSSR